MAEGQFATIIGSIEFPPQNRTVQGKEVTDVTIRSAATQKKVRVTIWPNLAGLAATLQKGQIVAFVGKASQNTVDGDDGPVTYNNLSAFSGAVLGQLTEGEKPPVDNAQPADDDIPF